MAASRIFSVVGTVYSEDDDATDRRLRETAPLLRAPLARVHFDVPMTSRIIAVVGTNSSEDDDATDRWFPETLPLLRAPLAVASVMLRGHHLGHGTGTYFHVDPSMAALFAAVFVTHDIIAVKLPGHISSLLLGLLVVGPVTLHGHRLVHDRWFRETGPLLRVPLAVGLVRLWGYHLLLATGTSFHIDSASSFFAVFNFSKDDEISSLLRGPLVIDLVALHGRRLIDDRWLGKTASLLRAPIVCSPVLTLFSNDLYHDIEPLIGFPTLGCYHLRPRSDCEMKNRTSAGRPVDVVNNRIKIKKKTCVGAKKTTKISRLRTPFMHFLVFIISLGCFNISGAASDDGARCEAVGLSIRIRDNCDVMDDKPSLTCCDAIFSTLGRMGCLCKVVEQPAFASSTISGGNMIIDLYNTCNGGPYVSATAEDDCFNKSSSPPPTPKNLSPSPISDAPGSNATPLF